ncbi:MAG: hypothetical protein LBR72_04805 [Oscillospiraceae bacterium]|jgi:Mg2+ and Co2+ transporter CorA|nr:hypothetical protein [Oscillospiraceae bacterium]
MWQVWVAAFAFGAALLLYALSVRKQFVQLREEAREAREMDAKIYRLYNEIEEMLDSFEAYVSEIHDEMESSRNELVAMSRQATTLYMQVMQPDAYPKPKPVEEPKPEKTEKPTPPPAREEKSKLSQRDLAELGKLEGKGKKIRFLMGRGLNMGEIARELKIGKGEIRLILDLDKD